MIFLSTFAKVIQHSLNIIDQYLREEIKISIREIYVEVKAEFEKDRGEFLKNEKEWLTRKEAAKYLSLSISTLQNITKSKQIPSSKIGDSIRYRKTALDEYLKSNER